MSFSKPLKWSEFCENTISLEFLNKYIKQSYLSFLSVFLYEKVQIIKSIFSFQCKRAHINIFYMNAKIAFHSMVKKPHNIHNAWYDVIYQSIEIGEIISKSCVQATTTENRKCSSRKKLKWKIFLLGSLTVNFDSM